MANWLDMFNILIHLNMSNKMIDIISINNLKNNIYLDMTSNIYLTIVIDFLDTKYIKYLMNIINKMYHKDNIQN